jgi:hypothetical protein
MKAFEIEEAMDILAESCCSTEQLEQYARGTLRAVHTAWVEAHVHGSGGCDICKARLALFETEPAQVVAEERAPGLWKQLSAGVFRLIEPIAITATEVGLQIQSGLTPLTAEPTLDSGENCVGGYNELPLGGEDAIEVRIKRLTASKVLVQINALDPMRTKVTLHEDESGTRHARYFLNPTLEFELSSGAWVLHVHQENVGQVRQIPLHFNASDKK